ncbi:response regulator [Anatilimnocola sp. NA78]|uniref:response regulator n=1 Tax=Anatilimnocola sp. NA78 TaxID=3415683 RepID=UPI003CE578D2
MPKRVLDIGNCSVDHGAISGMLTKQFGAEVIQAHGPEDSLVLLKQTHFDLVLVNRKLDQDYSDGLDIIHAMKADPQIAAVPVMLISNYPQYQEEAIESGALPGFGKKELYLDSTQENLSKLLK